MKEFILFLVFLFFISCNSRIDNPSLQYFGIYGYFYGGGYTKKINRVWISTSVWVGAWKMK